MHLCVKKQKNANLSHTDVIQYMISHVCMQTFYFATEYVDMRGSTLALCLTITTLCSGQAQCGKRCQVMASIHCPADEMEEKICKASLLPQGIIKTQQNNSKSHSME